MALRGEAAVSIRSDGSPLEGSLEMCDYCDFRSVDLIKRLGEEHASITAQGSIIRRLALFGDIAEARLRMVDLIAELNAHTEVEETALFPALRESPLEVTAAHLVAAHRCLAPLRSEAH